MTTSHNCATLLLSASDTFTDTKVGTTQSIFPATDKWKAVGLAATSLNLSSSRNFVVSLLPRRLILQLTTYLTRVLVLEHIPAYVLLNFWYNKAICLKKETKKPKHFFQDLSTCCCYYDLQLLRYTKLKANSILWFFYFQKSVSWMAILMQFLFCN